MSQRKLYWFVSGLPLFMVANAYGFAEDLCVDAGLVDNCTKAAQCSGGATDTTQCQANIVFQTGITTVQGTGRSMIHADATYFIAVALGFRADIAYWIAAYDEVTDLGGYVPFDKCGRALTTQTQYHAEPINGFQRTNAARGGFSYHFGTPYSPAGDGKDLQTAGITGLYPFYSPRTRQVQVEDIYEGTAAHARRWAMTPDLDTDYLQPVSCTNGYTQIGSASNGSRFGGNACYSPGGPITKLIRGTVPLLSINSTPVPFSAYHGAQYLMTDSTPTDLYYDKLPAILSAGKGKLQDGKPVPAEIARLGFYLHILQDRISHHYCGDASYSKYQPLDKVYYYSYDGANCTQNLHASLHYEEVGQTVLPLRTYTALNYTYDELKAFADTMRTTANGASWFTTKTPLSKASLVGITMPSSEYSGSERYVPGMVTRPLSIQAGAARMVAMNQAITDAGFTPMPGNDSSVTCP